MVHARARHGKQFTLHAGSTLIRITLMSQSWLKKKINAMELYTIDVILGRRADTGAAIYGAFLQVLSWLFNGIAQARLWCW